MLVHVFSPYGLSLDLVVEPSSSNYQNANFIIVFIIQKSLCISHDDRLCWNLQFVCQHKEWYWSISTQSWDKTNVFELSCQARSTLKYYSYSSFVLFFNEIKDTFSDWNGLRETVDLQGAAKTTALQATLYNVLLQSIGFWKVVGNSPMDHELKALCLS
jgi:hypothetical protein